MIEEIEHHVAYRLRLGDPPRVGIPSNIRWTISWTRKCWRPIFLAIVWVISLLVIVGCSLWPALPSVRGWRRSASVGRPRSASPRASVSADEPGTVIDRPHWGHLHRLPALAISRGSMDGVDAGCLRFGVRLTRPHARLASGCWPGSTGRDWLPTRLQRKVSEVIVTSRPPFPSFSWRNKKKRPDSLQCTAVLLSWSPRTSLPTLASENRLVNGPKTNATASHKLFRRLPP
jgi:hypothetical protein